jgi:hypothetical protein
MLCGDVTARRQLRGLACALLMRPPSPSCGSSLCYYGGDAAGVAWRGRGGASQSANRGFFQCSTVSSWRTITRNFTPLLANALIAAFADLHSHQAWIRAFNSARRVARCDGLHYFSPAMLRTTILTSLLATGQQGGYDAITTWLPTFLRIERKLTVLGITSRSSSSAR